jgi:hypothetical protein
VAERMVPKSGRRVTHPKYVTLVFGINLIPDIGAGQTGVIRAGDEVAPLP